MTPILTRSAVLALGASLVATAAAARGPPDPTEPVTITDASAARSPEDFQPVIDAFEAAHPTITVECQSIPSNDFDAVLAARIGGGDDTIDVFDADMPRIDASALRGWLADVTDAFPDIAARVGPGSIEAATVDGRLLAMPDQTSTTIPHCNRDLLGAAVIEPPSADPASRMTWEAVTEDARAALAVCGDGEGEPAALVRRMRRARGLVGQRGEAEQGLRSMWRHPIVERLTRRSDLHRCSDHRRPTRRNMVPEV